VAYEVPYLAITSVVNAATRERSQLRLLSSLRIFDSLRLAASQGLSPPQLFGRLAGISGYTLHLCSPSGRPPLSGIPGAPGGWAPAVSGTGVRQSELGLISVPVPLRGRIAGYLVAAEQDGREALGLLAVRREGAETLGEMLAGMLDPGAVRARLRLAGLDPGQPLILAAVANDLGQDTDLHSRLVDSDLPAAS
jgi:hypothetical protein